MNVLALFAGYGGLELGLSLAGEVSSFASRTVCYVEREAYAAANLVEKMEQGLLDRAPIWSDVTTFNGKPWRGKVDCITAGFPCQPWSIAGKREGTEDERWLWEDIERILCEVEPRIVFLENVPGLTHGGIEHVLGDMASLGFNVGWGVFPRKGFRSRLFFLAYSNSDNQPRDSVVKGNFRGTSREPARLDWLDVVAIKKPSCSWWNSKSPDRGVVNGSPKRVDRLRLAGNGVVPVVAAFAFIRSEEHTSELQSH